MPRMDPLPNWKDEDVFIIGGGPSLSGFDFHQISGECVIGCNHAYRLGADICHVAVFGDYKFWVGHREKLEAFDGWVVTNYKTMPLRTPPWLNYFPRLQRGLGRTELGWNLSTGATAINLALILGARRVYLLGVDLSRVSQSKTHWHSWTMSPQGQENYNRFAMGFEAVAKAIPMVFPGREVFNVSDGASRLKAFPIVSFADMGLKAPVREGAMSC